MIGIRCSSGFRGRPSGKVQQTKILGGLDRIPEKGDGKREWKRGSMKQAANAPTEKPWQKRQREAEEERAKRAARRKQVREEEASRAQWREPLVP